MDITIQRKPAFAVAGLLAKAIGPAQCPETWERLFEKHAWEDLARLGSGQSYGVCFDMQPDERFHYLAGYDVTDVTAAKDMGLDVLEIPETEYAVLPLKGAVPQAIHKGWQYAMGVYFPAHGYVHSGAPDFEVYGPGDLHAEDYAMALWIPVKKAE